MISLVGIVKEQVQNDKKLFKRKLKQFLQIFDFLLILKFNWRQLPVYFSSSIRKYVLYIYIYSKFIKDIITVAISQNPAYQ